MNSFVLNVWLQCCRSIFIIPSDPGALSLPSSLFYILKWTCLWLWSHAAAGQNTEDWGQSACVGSLLLHQVAVQDQCRYLTSVTWSELELIRLLLSADRTFWTSDWCFSNRPAHSCRRVSCLSEKTSTSSSWRREIFLFTSSALC